MRDDPQFFSRISQLRRLIIKRAIKRVIVAAFSLSLILISFVLAVQQSGLFHWAGYKVYPLLVLISFGFSVLYVLQTKKSFLDELIEIDARLELKDRLSTAYESHGRGRKSVFVDLLTEDAGNLLGSIKPDQYFPRKFSPAHILIPIFAVMTIILLSVDFAPPTPEQGRSGDATLKQIGERLERYSKNEHQGTKGGKKRSQKDLYEQMGKIAKELKNRAMTREGLLKSLGEMMEEAEAERTRMSRQLEADLNPGALTSVPVLKPLQEEKISPNELNELREQLKKLFEGRMPASLSQALYNLDRNCRLEEFLEGTIKEVRLGLPDDDESSSPEETHDVVAGKASEEGDKGQDSTDLKPAEGKAKWQTALAPGQAKDDSRESEQGGPDPDEDMPFTAGRGKAGGEKKSPSELEGSKGPAFKDKGDPGQGDWYSVYLRSLPSISKARLKEEDIVRPYRQALEDVLQKEDIPARYRQYIKAYFLSIGLGKEENGNVGTN